MMLKTGTTTGAANGTGAQSALARLTGRKAEGANPNPSVAAAIRNIAMLAKLSITTENMSQITTDRKKEEVKYERHAKGLEAEELVATLMKLARDSDRDVGRIAMEKLEQAMKDSQIVAGLADEAKANAEKLLEGRKTKESGLAPEALARNERARKQKITNGLVDGALGRDKNWLAVWSAVAEGLYPASKTDGLYREGAVKGSMMTLEEACRAVDVLPSEIQGLFTTVAKIRRAAQLIVLQDAVFGSFRRPSEAYMVKYNSKIRKISGEIEGALNDFNASEGNAARAEKLIARFVSAEIERVGEAADRASELGGIIRNIKMYNGDEAGIYMRTMRIEGIFGKLRAYEGKDAQHLEAKRLLGALDKFVEGSPSGIRKELKAAIGRSCEEKANAAPTEEEMQEKNLRYGIHRRPLDDDTPRAPVSRKR
jgi:hypothetical protein